MITIPIGQGSRPAHILARYANRHGLIAGATGTGKTYTLATLAQGFSRAGVPVFMADVKGDLAGLAHGSPVRFVDLFGLQGEPVKVRLDDLGADALARALSLSETQGDVLGAVLVAYAGQVATLADLRAALTVVAADHKRFSESFGLVTPSTLAAILRAVIRLEGEGGAAFFGGPTFDVADLMTQRDGAGLITMLAADRLIRSPKVYGAFMLFALGELFDRLPEVGDLDRPRLALIFDESHLIFQDAPPALIRRVEQVARLIRSKGVALFFASQSPADIPPAIAAQLGNRIQHAMRAATAQQRRELQGAADCLPDTRTGERAGDLISRLATGSALVALIGPKGEPGPSDVARIFPPTCPMGPLSPDDRARFIPPAPPPPAPAMPEPPPPVRRPSRLIPTLATLLCLALVAACLMT